MLDDFDEKLGVAIIRACRVFERIPPILFSLLSGILLPGSPRQFGQGHQVPPATFVVTFCRGQVDVPTVAECGACDIHSERESES